MSITFSDDMNVENTEIITPANKNLFLDAQTLKVRINSEARLIMCSEPHSVAADRFRLLCMQIRSLAKANNIKVLMVTSALPSEGKTTIALNLAIGLAERSGSKVVLVETDMRQPEISNRLNIGTHNGLVKCLQNGSDPLTALKFVEPLQIYLLPAGQATQSPIELINSESFANTISKLRSAADWVILDTPPAGPVPDVLDIRNHADACLWVAHAHATPREIVQDSIQQFGPEMVAGVVLNGTEDLEKAYSSYYGVKNPSLQMK